MNLKSSMLSLLIMGNFLQYVLLIMVNQNKTNYLRKYKMKKAKDKVSITCPRFDSLAYKHSEESVHIVFSHDYCIKVLSSILFHQIIPTQKLTIDC